MAAGRSDVLRRRPAGPTHGRIRDSRGSGLVPGLSNRDARRAFDARVAALRTALQEGDAAALGRGLGEALQLGLWRARKLTGFDALSEDVIGMPAAEARAHAARWAEQRESTLELLSETSVALWLRAEVVLSTLCPGACVWVEPATGMLSLQLPTSTPDETARVMAALARTARELDRVMQSERAGRAPRQTPRRHGSR